MSGHEGTDRAANRVQELLAENQALHLEVARIGGQLEVMKARVVAQDAADEQRRVELEVALRELGDVRAELKEAQVRADEWRRQARDLHDRLDEAERQREQAGQERAAVIAALGRRARKELERGPDQSP